MTINIGGGELKELKPRILVMGIGGAGGNAINAMIEDGLEGVEFVAVNTDAQDLKINKADAKIKSNIAFVGLGKVFQMWDPKLFENFKSTARKKSYLNRSNLKWDNKFKKEGVWQLISVVEN